MDILKKYFLLILSFCILSALLPLEVQSLPRHRRVRTRRAVRRTLVHKKYEYKQEHDINNDGRVDVKDRLLWLRKNKGDTSVAYVSKENEDLIEMMDVDNDGDVEQEEMDEFYQKYDTNNNGVLEDEEINSANVSE